MVDVCRGAVWCEVASGCVGDMWKKHETHNKSIREEESKMRRDHSSQEGRERGGEAAIRKKRERRQAEQRRIRSDDKGGQR